MSENKLGKYMARIYATNGFNIKGRFRTDANSLEKYKSGEKETLTLALGPRKFMPVLYAGKILEAIKYKSWNYSAMWDKKKLQGKIKH
jgi:hypothetical protein